MQASPATLALVKPWRIWLLLLLAVLQLPGPVAAAMLCAAAESGVRTDAAMGGHPAGHGSTDDAATHGHSSPGPVAGAAQDGHVGHDHGAAEGGNACSTYCSLMPLVSNLPPLVEPLDALAVKFDDLCGPAASFVSDGPERPPRTI